MKKAALILFSLLAVIAAEAQTNLDSLYTVWQDKTQAAPARLNAFHEFIVDKYLYSNPDSAFYLAGLHHEFAEGEGLKTQMGKALLLQSRALNAKGEYSQASEYCDRSIALFNEVSTEDLLAKSFMHKGNIHTGLGQYDSAYAYFNRSIELYQELDDSTGVATVLLRSAAAARNSTEYALAMEYAFEALRISENINEPRGIADAYVELSAILYYQDDYEGSIEYGKKALEFLEQTGDQESISEAYVEIGYSHLILGNLDTALVYMNRALDIRTAIGSSPRSIAYVVNGRGNVYKYLEEYDNALDDYMRSLAIYKEQGLEHRVAAPTANIGHVYVLMGKYEEALPYLIESIELRETTENKAQNWEGYLHTATAYEGLGQYKDALHWYQKYDVTTDSIFSVEKDRTLSELRTEYETEKKEEQILNLEKEAELKEQARQRDKLIKILLGVLAVLLVAFAFALWNRLAFVRKSRAIIQSERDRSETLLLNILPEEVAEELKNKGHSDAQLIDQVTVLFTDFKGFTSLSEKVTPKELVADLHEYFSLFDHICVKYGIEKIKTIGDAYMAAGGLPTPNSTHAKDVAQAALEMAKFVEKGKAKKQAAGEPFFEIRIGIHTGPVVAGIVGVKKFQYDIWGDTVNTASRMENSGAVGQVNISQTSYDLLKNDTAFRFESRGKIEAKGKGEIEMYFISNA